jgi:4-amino-4-deoxy-L-arabinose transferase-like glycosyltransferase
MKKVSNQSYIKILLLFLILLGYFLSRGINLPYVGYNAWNFNTYALIAHNYNAFGFLETKFAPIISVAANLPAKPSYYLNHPVLLPILMAQSFRLFGESFVTGRIVVITATLLSLILLYSIASFMGGRRYAMLSCAIFSLTPATALFGRMIGHEALVLFFVLLSVFLYLGYLRSGNFVYIVLLFISLALGVLTDWPMVYFTLILSCILWCEKRKKLAFFLFATAVVCAVLYILYASMLAGNSVFLLQGFINRSFGGVTHMHNWWLIWVGTIVFRLLFYFNPLFVSLAFASFFTIFFQKRRKLRAKRENLIVSFFIFGLIHVLLYPEGSFGHPYWLYYFLPFISLGGGYLIEANWQKYRIFFILIFVLSLVYITLIQEWKTREVQGNVFRSLLAKEAVSGLMPYETVALSREGLIDADIIQYQYLHPTILISLNVLCHPDYNKVVNSEKLTTQRIQSQHEKNCLDLANKTRVFIHSCIEKCTGRNIELLEKQFFTIRMQGEGVETMVVYFDKAPLSKSLKKRISISIPPNKESFFKNFYQQLMLFTHAPQL